MTELNRRDFVTLGGVALAATALAGVASAQDASPTSKPAAPAGQHQDLMKLMIPGAVDANGAWVLPPLPYAADALEPHIDAQTMTIHHDKHHQAYVTGLIAAEKKLAEARETGVFDLVQFWSQKLSFNGGGHFLHCVFWDSMGPGAGGEASGSLRTQIEKDFGSFEAFKKQFTAAAINVEGAGWGILGYQLASDRLTILQGQNQSLNSQWGLVPILVLDVWEHAYYLKYQNKRADYVNAWWNVVDWARVQKRFGLLRGEKH